MLVCFLSGMVLLFLFGYLQNIPPPPLSNHHMPFSLKVMWSHDPTFNTVVMLMSVSVTLQQYSSIRASVKNHLMRDNTFLSH